MNQGLDAPTRFAMKYRVTATGCWEWTSSTTGWSGYGRFYVDGKRKNVLAHRFAYEHAKGRVPEGLDLDHLCRNRLCVNPAHLEPVTRRENIVRGASRNAANAAKTHCHRGHELTQENCYAYRWPNQRQCKLCAREDAQRRYATKRQTNNLASAEQNAWALRKAIEEPVVRERPEDMDEIKRVVEMRHWMLTQGLPINALQATPSDLKRFNLQPWSGRFCGIECAESPIITEPA